MRTRSGKGRTPTRRDPDERAVQGDAFIDLIDELPGGDLDLDHELRQMGLATASGVYAHRRREL